MKIGFHTEEELKRYKIFNFYLAFRCRRCIKCGKLEK